MWGPCGLGGGPFPLGATSEVWSLGQSLQLSLQLSAGTQGGCYCRMQRSQNPREQRWMLGYVWRRAGEGWRQAWEGPSDHPWPLPMPFPYMSPMPRLCSQTGLGSIPHCHSVAGFKCGPVTFPPEPHFSCLQNGNNKSIYVFWVL